jgi:hypothetical protein
MEDTRVEQEKDNSVSGKFEDEDLRDATSNVDRMERLRSDSGNIEFSDALTEFLYLLMRDYLPAGKVEYIIDVVLDKPETCLYTNGFLAQYADNLANELKNVKVERLQNALNAAFEENVDKEEGSLKAAYAEELGDEETLSDLSDKVEDALKEMSEDDIDALEESTFKTKEDMIKEELWENEDGEENTTDTKDKKEYSNGIKSSLEAMENLKKLVPTESVKQILNILKTEIDSELNEDTRQSILEKKAEENKEHKSGLTGAERDAINYAKKELSEVNAKDDDNDDGASENIVSRGKLSDVASGRAFPEALDNMFPEDPNKNLENAKEAQKVMAELRSDFKNEKGVFRRANKRA